ncbi:DUF6078 family protein [uncultured Prevotella sp.]|uniref:DUF6078 family protein n=1 Tax=uncultured Prevotella sp. TaxID=159272 RepID=UPI00261931CC|nr:DUF6078 family protein [uncultured Prevotella sp.]
MPKKEYTTLPKEYPVCMHSSCPMATTCLHQKVYFTMMEQNEFLHLINPNRCSKDESCSYYRNCSPVSYARGFTKFQKQMFPDQYRRFMTICINHWSRNPYFERRRGARPLPPDEQDFILNALKQVGVTEEMEFDSYEENTNWYD